MKKSILPLLGLLVISASWIFAAETKDAAKEKATCCDESGSCCDEAAPKKDSKEVKDAKAPAEKPVEAKKS